MIGDGQGGERFHSDLGAGRPPGQAQALRRGGVCQHHEG